MKKFLIIIGCAFLGMMPASGVTFNVSVPLGTQKCYVCGSFNNWNVNEAPELMKSQDREDLFTLTLDDVESVSGGFKYLCGRSWEYVEKDASGGEINNRTTPGNPDIVGSWYHVPDYSVEADEVTVNGIKRLVKVYLPSDYYESEEEYPVIYYNTVQQRFNNAGDDSDAGDDFFAANSWNAGTAMEKLRAQGGKPYLMVQICSFLAENTPDSNPDFIGTGGAADYLSAFVNELIPYVKNKYRVKSGASSTTVVGADYGGIFSLYAALMRPDIFGNAVSMSPMLWINEGSLNSLVARAAPSVKFYLSSGGKEPSWIKEDLTSLYNDLKGAGADAYIIEFPDAAHTDDAWGASFPSILSAITSGTPPSVARSMKRKIGDDKKYTLYGGTSQNSLQKVGELEYAPVYYNGKSESPVEAMVITEIVPADIKTKYYWNIAKGDDSSAGWLLDTPKNLSFSSKKNADSWLNIAVLEDESVSNCGAHSRGFTVNTNGDKISMTQIGDFSSQAVVGFPGSDKSFTIHYGSVNSASDMGAATKAWSVSENCTEALITYDFNLNSVSIKETGFGESEPTIEFADRVYTLYGGSDQGNLQRIGELTLTEDYYMKGSDIPVVAQVITNNVAQSVTGTYYYNIAKGADSNDGWLWNSDKTVNFKSSKNAESWLNTAIFEDESSYTVAAHSKGFRVVTSGGDIAMTQGSGHLSTATVRFPGSDKRFHINYGSVNTASDMGALTADYAVSDNCIEAVITYDFNLNKVIIRETQSGANLDNIKIVAFEAVPAVTTSGTPVEINLSVSEKCDVTISCQRDFKEQVTFPVESVSPTSYHIVLSDPREGIYTFNVSLALGNNRLDDAAEVNVRVLPAAENQPYPLSINAYEDVDWENTGRYKANFHTHTSQSFDTQFNTSTVVDKYHKAGYKILALTDHDANSYPWEVFSLYNPEAEDRSPEAMDMLAIPGVELSKDRRNNWSESTGGDFNHHNDFFTGRKGQEFMSLRESYAYTDALGGMQIINHPGQYWNLNTSYSPGVKNSPEWHAENFRLYKSLIGLEVYNQGNRRPNDRILWDQILTINMPNFPVWGYSCDDTHTAEQYFRNYQFMLMPELSMDELKDAMRAGRTIFSYEFTGSGEDKAPHIKSISVDKDNNEIIIESDDADNIEWIYSTHRLSDAARAASAPKSTVVGLGKKFSFKGYCGSYVRARLTNKYGETATQPFGFGEYLGVGPTGIWGESDGPAFKLNVESDEGLQKATATCSEPILRISVFNAAGVMVRYLECQGENSISFSTEGFTPGVYVIVAATESSAYTAKLLY